MWRIFFDGIWLSAMSIADIRCRRIPVWMIGLGVPAALISLMLTWNAGSLEWAELMLSFVPGILLLLVSITGKAGYGDGLVMILLGLTVEGVAILRIFYLSFLFLSLAAVILLILRRVKRSTKLPYLPFLLTAWLTERIFL